jgi:hypothetical protein
MISKFPQCNFRGLLMAPKEGWQSMHERTFCDSIRNHVRAEKGFVETHVKG